METTFSNPMKLSEPFRVDKDVVVAAAFDSPDLGTITDTKRLANKNLYLGVKTWIDGSVIAYITEDGKRIDSAKDIKSTTFSMPIQTADTLAIAIALEHNKDDAVEGIYTCPRCGEEQVAEWTEGYDTRDHIRDLVITVAETVEDEVDIELDTPVVIRGKSRVTDEEAILEVKKISMRHPTIQDAINAKGKYGADDQESQQFAYYIEAFTKINDDPASPKEKAQYGMKIMRGIKRDDIKKFGQAVARHGIVNKVEKSCQKCRKHWKEVINTSSFFASALQQE
jgi:hypothetical protein